MITITQKDASIVDYVQLRVSGDQSEFIGPDHSDLVTQSLSLKSVAPKRGNNQYGNRRSQAVLVDGTTVTDLCGDSVVRNRKLAVESSLPVGTTFETLAKDAYAMSELLRNETFVMKLFTQGIIEY